VWKGRFLKSYRHRGEQPRSWAKENQAGKTKGAKVCPECSYQLAAKGKMPGVLCRDILTAKFCPECGKKLGN